MKRIKKVLKLKRIKIANMNFITGGGNEGHEESKVITCQSEDPKIDCSGTRNEASDIHNPCSDTCFTNQSDTRTIFMSMTC
ncbi:hypothetical protein [Kordia sp.]|uniref:hypothetical protein n=1 Tax=Kordia sp. TaxID=1965332 RepID=UPI003D26A926